ncbi:TetR/AcrR family transcriptional regulator [Rhizobium leguminosarum]
MAISPSLSLDLSTLRRNPVQSRSLEKVLAVLRAAESMLISDGYEHTARDPEKLIQLAGISTGSFYTYFANCEAVIEVLRQHYLSQAAQIAETIAENTYDDWREVIRALTRAYVKFYQQPAVRELLLYAPLSQPALNREREIDKQVAIKLRSSLHRTTREFDGLIQEKFEIAEEIAYRLLQYAFRLDVLGKQSVIEELNTAVISYLSANRSGESGKATQSLSG